MQNAVIKRKKMKIKMVKAIPIDTKVTADPLTFHVKQTQEATSVKLGVTNCLLAQP